jgi:hypothetical protein
VAAQVIQEEKKGTRCTQRLFCKQKQMSESAILLPGCPIAGRTSDHMASSKSSEQVREHGHEVFRSGV